MARKTVLTDSVARDIANAIGLRCFDCHSYDAKYNAQRNLSGKTHYADSDTLKFFNARIISTRVSHEGLIFGMVESIPEGFQGRKRAFRFIAFDLFGTVLNERDTEFSTSDKARAAMVEWCDSFAVLPHYKRAMMERAARLKQDAANWEKGAKAIRL
jgi:hypothetical protein